MQILTYGPQIYRPPDAPAPMHWRDWPMFAPWHRSILPVTLLLLGFTASLTLIAHPGVRWIPPAMLWISLAKWWLPTTYEVSSRGVEIEFCGRRRCIPWRSIGSVHEVASGFWLAPRNLVLRIDGLRGTFLPCEHRRKHLLLLLAFYHLGPIKLTTLQLPQPNDAA